MPATEMFHNLISIFYREINKQRNILRKLLLVESTYIAILTCTASDNGKNLYHWYNARANATDLSWRRT